DIVAGFSRIPRVYYVVGFGEGGDWTAGGDTFISQMITMAGGENIASDISGWSFSLEAIVEGDPDLILIPSWAESIFETTPVYSDLRAVKNGNIIVIDENSIVRQGPRLAEGFANLVSAIGSVL
ncbi:MAG: ABC transporter substrate-binding protein, partial [Spirochaetaceae bacterium]|nr:ABC transporter substrate-binding protein [Spirochaetaceae bacterium]